MDIENQTKIERSIIENEKCKGKIYVGSIIGGIVGLTFLIKWIVEMYTEKDVV